MISGTSLAAFSTGIATSPLGQSGMMRPIRTLESGPAGGAAPAPLLKSAPQTPAQGPGQILPRGSLLNLSV
ncbi:MAG TPA: hypothetical protein VMU82_19970 [Acetobacteraceae bacterium]|nr:hypothetical protein [Acetobacteraceae bacterium]